VKINETKPTETSPDNNHKEPIDTSTTRTQAGSIATPAADNTKREGKTTDASALQAWLAKIRARIATTKRYPMMAERRRIQGKVIVSF